MSRSLLCSLLKQEWLYCFKTLKEYEKKHCWIFLCFEQVVGVPVGSTLPSTVKQAVAISGGQILVAKASSSVAKAVGPKQVVTQGVAKAIVSGGGGTIVAQPVQTLTKAQVTAAGPQKSGSQGSGTDTNWGPFQQQPLPKSSVLVILFAIWFSLGKLSRLKL